MIRLTENLLIGDSADESHAILSGKDAILNVAQDLQCTRGWTDGIEYMQVGLIDGPGNPMSAYYSAVFALHTLLSRARGSVLVCCHTGGRAMAVIMMYLQSTAKRSWDDWLNLLHERVEWELPTPHNAHKEAFDKMDLNSLLHPGSILY